ncbi:c-type cytochrome [Ferruginibacter sp.]|nr:cytochrome c [Ferruginibacter sp.]
MKKILIIVTTLSIVFFGACSKKANPTKTDGTTVETPAKPAATVYNSAVQSLIQAKCTPCHIPSKGGFKANLDGYDLSKKYIADIIARIEKNPGDKGFMPFKNPKLSAEEIGVFKKWLAEGLLEK